MGKKFSDITIYLPLPENASASEADEEQRTANFVCDLYVRKMNGYKPPNTTRITIQPYYHHIWGRTWKNGSNVAIAPFYNYETYSQLDKNGKLKYLLDLIQTSTIQLSDEYGWDKCVFEDAYNAILDCNFEFKIDYPAKTSRDRKKQAWLTIEKTEHTTTVYLTINNTGKELKMVLFDKKNWYSFDCVYALVKYCKWFDNDIFGISYCKGLIEVWYSIEHDEVAFILNGKDVKSIDFSMNLVNIIY